MFLPEIPNQGEEEKDPSYHKRLKIIGVRGAAVSDEELADYVKGVAAGTGFSPEDIMTEILLVRRDKEI